MCTVGVSLWAGVRAAAADAVGSWASDAFQPAKLPGAGNTHPAATTYQVPCCLAYAASDTTRTGALGRQLLHKAFCSYLKNTSKKGPAVQLRSGVGVGRETHTEP